MAISARDNNTPSVVNLANKFPCFMQSHARTDVTTWVGENETSFDCTPWKLICKHSISPDHWGSGVYIELQMIFPWLAWGLRKKHPAAFGQGLLFCLEQMAAARMLPSTCLHLGLPLLSSHASETTITAATAEDGSSIVFRNICFRDSMKMTYKRSCAHTFHLQIQISLQKNYIVFSNALNMFSSGSFILFI